MAKILTPRENLLLMASELQSLNPLSCALLVMNIAHAGQFRADGVTPFIAHPLRARDIFDVQFAPGYASLSAPEDGAIILILHDVVEDTDILMDDLKKLFNERIIGCLQLMTKDTESDTYISYVRRLAHSGNQLAVDCKICDIQANLEDLENFPDKKARELRRSKYHLARFILTDYVRLYNKNQAE